MSNLWFAKKVEEAYKDLRLPNSISATVQAVKFQRQERLCFYQLLSAESR